MSRSILEHFSNALRGVQRRLAPQGDIRGSLLALTTILVLVLVGLMCLRVLALSPAIPAGGAAPPIIQSLQNISDNISATIFVAICLSIVVIIISPPIFFKEDIAVLLPANIGPALRQPLAETKEYWWRGRSGRFFRNTVLPNLDMAARQNQTAMRIYVLLPDPHHDEMLGRYAQYRNSASTRNAKVWTKKSIRIEILASILSVLRYRANNVFFEPEIAIESSFTLFRADLSDRYLVLTREEPTWPGYISSSGTKFYDSYREELRLQMDWGHRIEIPEEMPSGKWSLDETKSVLASLRRLAGIELTDDDYEQIQRGLDDPENPYGN